MSEQLLIALAVLVVFCVYVGAKVWSYMRQSDTDWSQVDKTRLREWEEDDDWPDS